ncbi:MAG: serine/threonine-protein kinase [Balneolaceae bacterium]
MDDFNWQEVETIIDDVLDLPHHQRKNHIKEKCGSNEVLKNTVTQLLESIFASEGWLEELKEHKYDFYDDSNEIKAHTEDFDFKGHKVGAYTIRKKIGQGGMGIVYRGERADGDFEHTVAIKLIRTGMDTPENIRLFNRERNILAGLNHPGIAKLFDGGVIQNGAPYLVMEYVEGTPIVQYCDEKKLTIDERINLFLNVLEAVRHAHENLIIHHDLKPDNIFITEEGQVKILDFGIAKLLDTGVEHSDNLTLTRARILTPKYASPEQIRQESVTTATDMYALGIILHQLLTGLHPYNLQNKSVYETEQTVLNTEPRLPSYRLSSTEGSEVIAEKRSEKPLSLIRHLRGDLDAIQLKGIEKNPTQRYRTARELTNELEKYRSALPVSARNSTFGYRFNKFLSRNRVALSIVGLFILITTLFLFYHTNQISKERDQAEFQAQKATSVQSFLVDIFRYNNPNADEYAGKDLTAQELLQTGLANVEDDLQHQPETQIGIMTSIGEALRNLDELDEAEQAMQKAIEKSETHFGTNDLRTASIYTSLALLKRDAGEYEESDELIREAIEINETSTDTALKQLANKYSILAYNQAHQSQFDKSEELFLYADSLYIASEDSNSVERYNTLSNYAEVKSRMGKHNEALEFNKKALDFYRELYGHDHLNIATTLNKMGKNHHHLGNHSEADQYYRQSLEIKLKLMDEDNTAVASTYQSMAINLRVMGHYKKAEEYALKDLEIMQQVYDEDNIRIVFSLNIVALTKQDLEEYEEAEQIYKKIIAIQEAYYDEENTQLAATIYNLASLYQITKRYEEAYPMYERVVSIDKKNLGDEHPEVAVDLNKLGDVSREMGSYSRADSIYTEAKSIFIDAYPDDHYRVAEHFLSHGRLKLKQRKFREAGEDFEQAAEIFEENFGEDDRRVEEAYSYLEKTREETSFR